jgi:hypothetical protein
MVGPPRVTWPQSARLGSLPGAEDGNEDGGDTDRDEEPQPMAEMRGASDNSTEQRCRDPQENRREDSDRLSARNDQSPEPADDEPDQRPPQQHRREPEGSPTDDRQNHDRRDEEKHKNHDCLITQLAPHVHPRPPGECCSGAYVSQVTGHADDGTYGRRPIRL